VRLADLLAPGRVLVPLRASDVSEAVRALVEACTADGRVKDPEELERVRREARPEDVVTLGPHAFLPHFRTDAVDRVVAALGVTAAPLPWPAEPDRTARIVLLVLAPPRAAVPYLQALAAFTRALGEPDVVARLHAAAGGGEVLALPGFADVELEGPLLVRDIMTRDVLSVAPAAPLREAARLLVEHRWEAVPVVGEGGDVVGLVTNRELLRLLGPAYIQRVNTGEVPAVPRAAAHAAARPLDLPVRDAMARSVLCVSEDQSVADVAALMANKNVDRCPVVKDGQLTGFLTRADIVRKLVGT
jgi:CBS domain-containing protein/mannitol/fructose-specific phosphotransferase system IIA component (Ntr-type)